MFNLTGTPPQQIKAQVLSRLPDALRKPSTTNDWGLANKPGAMLDSFLEGPVFDASGNLFVTDIPNGRILKLDTQKQWTMVCEYDGWPNGLAMDANGMLWIADYAKGLLRLDPSTGALSTVLGHRNSESFKGLNDLTFDSDGFLYFTDQGQAGLHDPTGRVYRYCPKTARLDCLVDTVPSPNGVAVLQSGSGTSKTLFVAVTRGNQVWRAPLLADGSLSKMGALQTFYGISGPDGLALRADGSLLVAHASLGLFVLSPKGEVLAVVTTPDGSHGVTNVALVPYSNAVVMTDSNNGCVLMATIN